MRGSSHLEGMAAFLAGAGLGAALARGLPEPGWRPGGGGRARNLPGTGRAAHVAANLGRMQAVLGEIRGLLGPKPAAPEAAAAPPFPPPGGRDAWRTPDRIGYWVRGGAADGKDLLALGAAAIGAAAAYASIAIRRRGAAAAWPALAGFLAAGAWGAWSLRSEAAGTGRRGSPAPMPGSKAGRSGRPAMP